MTEEQIILFEEAIKAIKALKTDPTFWEEEKASNEEDSIRIEKQNEDLKMSEELFKIGGINNG